MCELLTHGESQGGGPVLAHDEGQIYIVCVLGCNGMKGPWL